MTLSVSLSHRLGDFALDVAFEAPPGLTVLYGRSGSGKTSIVNAVAGLLRPAQGRIVVSGAVLMDTERGIWLPTYRRRLGTIFQEGRLLPHLSVRQNLLYGRWFAPREASGMALERVVAMLGLEPLLARRPGALSGGEKQRVAIGRALLAKPALILADEPLAALDEARKAEILPCLERLRDEAGVPILYVSHAPSEVARLATTVVAIENGRVAAQGPALTILGDPSVTPLGVRAAGAVLEARVMEHHADGLTTLDAGGAALLVPHVPHAHGAQLRVRIAAQDVILARDQPSGLSALNVLAGTVESIRQGDGPGAIVALRTQAGRILARVTRRSVTAMGLHVGMACHAIIKTVAIAPDDVSGDHGL